MKELTEILLHSGASFIRQWSSFLVLESSASGIAKQSGASITKWDNFHDEVRQFLQSRTVQKVSKTNGERH